MKTKDAIFGIFFSEFGFSEELCLFDLVFSSNLNVASMLASTDLNFKQHNECNNRSSRITGFWR